MQQTQQYNVVITGGGSGIGAVLAETLSGLGHSVTICGRRKNKLQDVAEKNANITMFQCDVSSEKEVKAFKRFVNKRRGHIDILINCAGLFGSIGRFDRTDSSLWRKTFEINTFGTYLVSKHFLPLLLKSGVKIIINFSGGGAFNTFPNYSAYAVSKAAVVRLSEIIADELADEGVRVNCVAPGFVATEIHDSTLSASKKIAGDHYELTRAKLKTGSVPMEVVVNCIKFLISEKANGLTGKTISASFDKWGSEEFQNSIELINNSDLYTMRRINLVNMEQNNPLRKIL